jgi:hypothetical protein
MYAVKPSNAVTSIKQSPVLKGHKTYNIVDHPSKICVTKMPAVILVTPTNNRVFDPRVYYRQELYIAFIRIGVHYIYTFKPALRRHIWDK